MAPSPLSAPGDLLAVAVGRCQVILAWTAGQTAGLGFRIERATGNGAGLLFADIGGVGAQVTAFRDESVKLRTTYTYRIVAWDAGGDSSPSPQVEVTTPWRKTLEPSGP